MPAPRGDTRASGRMTPEIRRFTAAELTRYAEGIRAVYAEAFAEPPWDEGPEQADEYLRRLAADAGRPGFVGVVAVAESTGAVLGFCTAWTTTTPMPTGRSYDRVAETLGPERTRAWLCGALEVDELAVSGAARGTGAAAALLEAVTADAVDGRSWLLTSTQAEPALRFYARQGWRRIASAEWPGTVVLLHPRHPAHDAAVPQGQGAERSNQSLFASRPNSGSLGGSAGSSST
ncbi:GNAT family N-acetyltransferase [Embleya sp. NPDC050154]|uniref:GNAT family N-acetyltransferase n=1 Tax=unclassified Embleya TaxID=2699296 RepID=UPI00378D3087